MECRGRELGLLRISVCDFESDIRVIVICLQLEEKMSLQRDRKRERKGSWLLARVNMMVYLMMSGSLCLKC